MKEILALYNEIAQGLNAEPSRLDPLFWERKDGTAIAMDWCEGFMEAFALRKTQWDGFMETEQGQEWMFPILAHLFDNHDNSLSGASREDLPAVLNEASGLISSTVPKIYNYWKSKQASSRDDTFVDKIDSATAPSQSANIVKFPVKGARETPVDPGIPELDPLRSYAKEILQEISEQELFALLIGHEDRLPMEVIIECKTRGDAIVPWLHEHLMDDTNWSEDVDSRDWWALLHAVMILGLIPGELASNSLVESFRRIDFDFNNDLADWVCGYWPALFRNKSEHADNAMREIAEHSDLDWYPRIHAMECVLATAYEFYEERLETEIDWVAGQTEDQQQESGFRVMAANLLLDFPRERHRLLMDVAADLQLTDSWYRNTFSRQEIRYAFARGDEASWLRFDNPWKFYEPVEIIRRQERWAKEDAERKSQPSDRDRIDEGLLARLGASHLKTYIHHEPKIGRNDPCPCGSGKKYKKCCLSRLH